MAEQSSCGFKFVREKLFRGGRVEGVMHNLAV